MALAVAVSCTVALAALAVCLWQPRNIVRVGERWKLIDLDATVRIGGHVGVKRSTGYNGPELLCLDGALLPGASPTFDVWGLV